MALWIALPLAAWGNPPVVSVTGSGTVHVQPDLLEIGGRVAASAEKAADALAAYRKLKAAVLTALDGLALENLSVDGAGVSLGMPGQGGDRMQVLIQQAQGGGGQGPPAAPKQKVEVSERLTLRLRGIDKMKRADVLALVGRLLGAARAAGVQFGPPKRSQMEEMIALQTGGPSRPLVVFGVGDLTAAREQATERAMADARRRAGRLATLGGATLGKVLTIRESAVESPEASSAGMQYLTLLNRMSAAGPGEGSSGTLAPIAVQARLAVTFDLER